MDPKSTGNWKAWCAKLLLATLLVALSICAATAQVVYNGQRSTVVSGTQTFISTGPTFLEPSGLVVDHNGNLFVNDEGTGSIYKYVPSGGGFTLSSEYPQYTTVSAVNNECADLTFEIAVDAQNHLYYPAASEAFTAAPITAISRLVATTSNVLPCSGVIATISFTYWLSRCAFTNRAFIPEIKNRPGPSR